MNGKDKPYYLRKVFLECAIDNPDLLDCKYTHYWAGSGFLIRKRDSDWDRVVELIKTIVVTDSSENKPEGSDDSEKKNEGRDVNNPHPKLREFHLRTKTDIGGEKEQKWKVRDVFREAAIEDNTLLHGIGEYYDNEDGFCD